MTRDVIGTLVTRSARCGDLLGLKRIRLVTEGHCVFAHIALKLLNELTYLLKASSSLASFKKLFKTFISKMFL